MEQRNEREKGNRLGGSEKQKTKVEPKRETSEKDEWQRDNKEVEQTEKRTKRNRESKRREWTKRKKVWVESLAQDLNIDSVTVSGLDLDTGGGVKGGM